MFEIGNIVKQVTSFWDGIPFTPTDKLYVISKIDADESGYKYGIRNIETGSDSYWWSDHHFELVDKGSIELARQLRDKYLENYKIE